VFASELFGRVDFYKSPLAELTEGGMGGVVDLQTPRPFDSPKRTIRYAVTGAYNTSSEKADPAGFALYSNTWGSWGFLAGVAHSKARQQPLRLRGHRRLQQLAQRQRRTRCKGNFAWRSTTTTRAPTCPAIPATRSTNALLPRIYRFYGSQNRRSRDGMVSSLQFKQGDPEHQPGRPVFAS
jgi:iron complex outermembrane receptor protein